MTSGGKKQLGLPGERHWYPADLLPGSRGRTWKVVTLVPLFAILVRPRSMFQVIFMWFKLLAQFVGSRGWRCSGGSQCLAQVASAELFCLLVMFYLEITHNAIECNLVK